MNYRVVFRNLGYVSLTLAGLLLLPMIVCFCYQEDCWWAFLAVSGLSLALGLPLVFLVKPKDQVFFSREGLIIVSLAWVYISLLGALPFVISGTIPSFVDALFETVSGLTTTGATVLSGVQIENMSKGMLFWRSFTQWIGGMGVIVFIMAVVNGSAESGMHVLRAEMPGPTVDKVVPRARTTARVLYLIYVVFTLAQVILLVCGGMPLFDSVVHTFGSVGTGGLSIKADSIASYNAFCQWVIAVFMILCGINFNLYYLIVVRKFRTAFSSRELWIYCGLIFVCSAVSVINVLGRLPYTQNVGESIRLAVFQVASAISSTGYTTIPATSSLNDLPNLTKCLLFMLMIIGGCAGSTAGGLKVSRLAILCCSVRKTLRKVLHPRNASSVRYDGKPLSEEVMHGVTSYFALYMMVLFVTFVLLSLDSSAGLTFESNLSAAVSCFNNNGLLFGAPSAGFGAYSAFSRVVMVLAMLLGRLEIYPLLLCFSPSTWIRK